MAGDIFYLNHNATLLCGHGGRLMLKTLPDHSFWDNGAPILTQEDLLIRVMIVGCPQAGPGIVPCTKVAMIMMGLSQKFKVDPPQETPVLETLVALTNGVPPGKVMVVDNGQSDCKTLGNVGMPPTAPPPPKPGKSPAPAPKPSTLRPAVPLGGEEKKKKTHWIEIELVDEEGNPIPDEPYSVKLPDGSTVEGSLDKKGFARIDGIENPGTCQVTFPNRDQDQWKRS